MSGMLVDPSMMTYYNRLLGQPKRNFWRLGEQTSRLAGPCEGDAMIPTSRVLLVAEKSIVCMCMYKCRCIDTGI